MSKLIEYENTEKIKLKLQIISEIASRAESLQIQHTSVLSLMMDIALAYLEFDLKLDELLVADDFNFVHDISGIQSNINRETATFINGFIPRFASTGV